MSSPESKPAGTPSTPNTPSAPGAPLIPGNAEERLLYAQLLRQEAQAKLAAIVESSDDAIVSKTLDGVVNTWNRGAERIFGFTADEMVGHPILKIIPDDRVQEEYDILTRLRRGERVDHFETIRRRKDASLIDVSVTISPIRDSSGRIIGASKIARDISAQKQIQRELAAAKAAAEAANIAKDRFLSALSHELRTPLTPALATLSFLEHSGGLSPELLEDIKIIRRNVETEARLVDDLLDLTRITRGKMALHFEVVDLHSITRNALAMFQTDIDHKGIEVSIALRARDSHVWADSGRIQQVLANLISNAVKFTPAGGSVFLRSENHAEQRIRVEVRDTGVGIDDSMLQRLFNPFEQGDHRSIRAGGLGLGLSISRSLMEMHHGTISATSAGPGKGATFVVELGTVSASQEKNGASEDAAASGRMGLRVLLVEDHDDTRQIMTRLLDKFGCNVKTASSVAEAVALADREPFDLLVSDLGLPDGSGMEVMRHVRARGQAIPGVALSGYGQPEDIRRSEEAGFSTHLTKPINLHKLREVLQKVTK